MLLRDYKLN